ncbi:MULTISPECIES: two pore domain potassium channel family protein [unclassified Lentimicrobium]|uniref:two pore domain potassium channel family protein n=1 Tax=unclassified Lentimicrobium TaxID=2677434 RepID=UPI001555CFDE|nr:MULTISPECIES: two pore domain potassium channel family protein [unclassified Lentimicrobium]NPD47521.1 two pore domain potassium channel family protein [Lentimicrobium sp. S6]NPD84668.1 two pore domain potassium channel family protein [Lentimicrobium sp. L6]
MKKRIIYPIILLVYFVLLVILVIVESDKEASSIKNIWNAICYLLVTISTIGYGDVTPLHLLEKI